MLSPKTCIICSTLCTKVRSILLKKTLLLFLMWPRINRLKVYLKSKTKMNKMIPYMSCHRLLITKKKQICEICDYKAKLSEILKNHVESVYQGVHYPCYQCDYEEKLKCLLRQHAKCVHKGIHYACDLCNYKAGEKQCLQEHIMSIHKGNH